MSGRRNGSSSSKNGATADRLPPYNVTAESGYLGLLLRGEAEPGAVEPADFFCDSNRMVYEAALDVAKETGRADPIVVADRLTRSQALGTDNPDVRLSEYMNQAPSSAQAEEYAAIILETSSLRGIIELCERSLKAAYARTVCADDQLAAIQKGISRIQSRAARMPADFATLADATRVIGETQPLWTGWIDKGVMSLIAGPAGCGKTRTAVDFARRIYNKDALPDGTPSPFPKGTPTLWMMIDRNWAETAAVARNFGVPEEAIHLCSTKGNPLHLPDLDQARTITDLEAQIDLVKPAMLVVDTITYATTYNTAKAEEVKAAFDPLLTLAASTGVTILALAHLNAQGEVLNRRLVERARSVIMISHPDPEGQPDRRRLAVSKSAQKKPPALGITFTDSANQYDDAPPDEPAKPGSGKRRGPGPKKSLEIAEWLHDLIESFNGAPVAVGRIIELAGDRGFIGRLDDNGDWTALRALYRGRDRVPDLPAPRSGKRVDKEELPTESGRKRKYWRLADAAVAEESKSSDAPF